MPSTALGGFDEGYFLHCEDLDLCRRARDAGLAVLYVPTLSVRHEQGSSSFRRPLFVSRHKHRGMWRYFRKFDPAARNPVLKGLVCCGIWAHFALLAPLACLESSIASVRAEGRAHACSSVQSRKMKNAATTISANPTTWFHLIAAPSQVTENTTKTSRVMISWIVFSCAGL